MKITKEILQDLVWEETVGQYKSIKKELIDSSRWSLFYEQIIQDTFTGKFYLTTYSEGATEVQDEEPYEYEDDEIEVREVRPVEKTIIVYE